jgi:hypothetical protein
VFHDHTFTIVRENHLFHVRLDPLEFFGLGKPLRCGGCGSGGNGGGGGRGSDGVFPRNVSILMYAR